MFMSYRVLCYICHILHCFTFQNKQGMENEKIDYLAVRLQTFETENERLKGDVVRLKNDNDRLRMVSKWSSLNEMEIILFFLLYLL